MLDVPPFTWPDNQVQELDLGFMSKEAEGGVGVSAHERAFLVWIPEPHPHPSINTIIGIVHRPLEIQVMTYPDLRGELVRTFEMFTHD